jgi:flagellar L-ring protein precursor FlgH
MAWMGEVIRQEPLDGRGQLRLVEAERARAASQPLVLPESGGPRVKRVAAELDSSFQERDIQVVRSQDPLQRSYSGPLPLGDPGTTSSLWRESRATNEVFRDFRAWQPMDLVTIVVTEQSLGQQLANTEVKAKSEYLAAIENFFGLEQQTQNWTNPPDLTSLIQAQTRNDFRGEGRTLRQAQLNARVSAVVAEVLPSGLLRIEGEKIIAVNNEEQVLVISGLVRQRDINSINEVNASQIAQVRIDYYGKGTVGEAQYGGWLSRLLRILWPF